MNQHNGVKKGHIERKSWPNIETEERTRMCVCVCVRVCVCNLHTREKAHREELAQGSRGLVRLILEQKDQRGKWKI